jgi:hypothetical protein
MTPRQITFRYAVAKILSLSKIILLKSNAKIWQCSNRSSGQEKYFCKLNISVKI